MTKKQCGRQRRVVTVDMIPREEFYRLKRHMTFEEAQVKADKANSLPFNQREAVPVRQTDPITHEEYWVIRRYPRK